MMKKIMMILALTNVIVSRLPEHRVTGTPTARANYQTEEVVVHTGTKNAEEVNIVIVGALGLAKTKKIHNAEPVLDHIIDKIEYNSLPLCIKTLFIHTLVWPHRQCLVILLCITSM